jgi:hypothetical protein
MNLGGHMNTSKKIAWRTAAVAAAALFSAGLAHADQRGDYRGGRSGDEHHRVWRDYGRGHFDRHYDSHHYWHPEHRYNREYYPHRYYGYAPYRYEEYRPTRDYGARVYLDIPIL